MLFKFLTKNKQFGKFVNCDNALLCEEAPLSLLVYAREMSRCSNANIHVTVSSHLKFQKMLLSKSLYPAKRKMDCVSLVIYLNADFRKKKD